MASTLRDIAAAHICSRFPYPDLAPRQSLFRTIYPRLVFIDPLFPLSLDLTPSRFSLAPAAFPTIEFRVEHFDKREFTTLRCISCSTPRCSSSILCPGEKSVNVYRMQTHKNIIKRESAQHQRERLYVGASALDARVQKKNAQKNKFEKTYMHMYTSSSGNARTMNNE